jgi:hypothetical protein
VRDYARAVPVLVIVAVIVAVALEELVVNDGIIGLFTRLFDAIEAFVVRVARRVRRGKA